jgi:hypothetical protein
MNKEIYRHLSKRDLCGILDLTYLNLALKRSISIEIHVQQGFTGTYARKSL